ncbi:MAG TPA: C39 family peptidase [Humisphaera sp.]
MPYRLVVTLLLGLLYAVPARAVEPADDADGVGKDDDEPIVLPASRPSSRPSRAATRNPPGAVDRLVQVDTADAWSAGTLRNANVVPGPPARVQLGYREADFPRVGTWVGPEVPTRFPFTSLIATFNPTTPPQTGATLDVRVRVAGVWSPWLYAQSWGQVPTPADRAVRFDGGRVDVDELELEKPADAYQARVTLVSYGFDRDAVPAVRRLSVSYTGVMTDPQVLKLAQRPKPHLPSKSGDWARDLSVPFRGQGELKNPKVLRGLICSPTSVAMVMAYHGVDRATVETAMSIYDPTHEMFGNWGRAVACAGAAGLDAWVDRFRDWDAVKAEVARGNPVVASIKFDRGEVKGFLYERTRGHLLVVRGFKPNGDVIVNDPARREKGNGVVILPGEFAKAWFDNGGVGYVIRKPERATTPAAADGAR